jgi:hypothetical protein
MADEKKPDAPTINIRFLFNFCNDVEAVRRFYTDLLGMKQGSFKNEKEWGWVVYRSQGLELMFLRADEKDKLPIPEGFAAQPGWAGGTRVVTSWLSNILKTNSRRPANVSRKPKFACSSRCPNGGRRVIGD